jgi:hypothetical protein
MPFGWDDAAILGGSAIGAIGGMFGSNSAAKAQEEAAAKQQQYAQRNMLYQTALNEPGRQMGYNAMGDISAEFGYGMSPYQSAQELGQIATPMSYQNAKRYLGQGASFEDLMKMGSLSTPGKKGIKRLIKAGLTMDQITQLQATSRLPGAPQGPQGGQQPIGRGFSASPDYAFRKSEGMQGIGNSFAARGGAASGNALKALNEFNSNLASSEYGNWFNRRAQLAGFGQASTNNQGQAANNYAQGASQAAGNAGDARASGIMGGVNSLTGAINGGLNSWLMSKYMSQPQGGYGGGYGIGGQGGGALPPGMNPGIWDQLNYGG